MLVYMVTDIYSTLGTYCIYQKTNNCPFGFKSGSITWDDEKDNNKNKENGTLPKVDLHIHSQTKIYFCCRNDGYKTIPINLPAGSPFYLFAHKTLSCQQVKWAVATSEWIEYDTEDDNNQDSVSASAPYVKTEYPGLKIYYCYYTSKMLIVLTLLCVIPLFLCSNLVSM